MVKVLLVGGSRALCKLKDVESRPGTGQSDSHAAGEISEFPSQEA